MLEITHSVKLIRNAYFQTLGDPVVCVATMVLAATLAHVFHDTVQENHNSTVPALKPSSSIDVSGTLTGNGLDTYDFPVIHEKEFSSNARSTVLTRPSRRMVVMFCLIKLVLVPGVGFGLLLGFARWPGSIARVLLPEDPLMRLLLMVQFATPRLVIVVLKGCYTP